MKIIITLIFIIVSLNAFAGRFAEYVTVSGQLINFNEKYVYLKSEKGKKIIVPRKYFTERMLKQKKQFTINIEDADYEKVIEDTSKQ